MEIIPKISICIPTYNGASFLEECIISCVSQTFKDFEIIIVDDGSVDDTLNILKKYLKDDARIKIFVNDKNLGLVANWNRCIELANGEWIKFVFQDDYLETNCLQLFMNSIESDSQLLVSKRSFILPDNVLPGEKIYYETEVRTLENTGSLINGNVVAPDIISRISAKNIGLNFIGEPSLTMFRKNSVNRIGYFNKDLAQICDLEFFLRLASTEGLIYIPEKLCHFRIHGSSVTSSNLQSKAYILTHLEPIILVRQMLFDVQFSSLRNFLTPGLLWKLNNFFKVRSYEARINSNENFSYKILFENTIFKFAEIKELSKGNLVTKLKYLLILLRRQIRKLKP